MFYWQCNNNCRLSPKISNNWDLHCVRFRCFVPWNFTWPLMTFFVVVFRTHPDFCFIVRVPRSKSCMAKVLPHPRCLFLCSFWIWRNTFDVQYFTSEITKRWSKEKRQGSGLEPRSDGTTIQLAIASLALKTLQTLDTMVACLKQAARS